VRNGVRSLGAVEVDDQLIADVEAGTDVLITRRGQAVARLVAEPGAGGYGWAALRAWLAAEPTEGPSVAQMREDDLL